MNSIKSVAIIGKGPSVSFGNSDMYNNFDEIALINWPIMNYDYMPQRCDSMFTHYFGDQERDLNRKKMRPTTPAWNIENIHKYNTKNIYCVIPNDINYIKKHIPNKYYDTEIKNLRYIYDIVGFNCDSGLVALTYYCEQKNIESIFFIGFDIYSGKNLNDIYYFPFPTNITETIDVINIDCHNKEKTRNYLQNIGKKYPHIQFYYKSKINFIEYNNFKEYK